MQHLLELSQCSTTEINRLIDRAFALKQGAEPKHLPNAMVGLLFFEPSTRTRCSFEIAAKKLAMQTLYLDGEHTSLQKGESINDTLANLLAMGVHTFVLRHGDADIFSKISASLLKQVHLINAGNGAYGHPSQALIDAMTIKQYKTCFKNLSVALVGDIIHSRVAASNIECLAQLGVKDIRCIAPQAWLPKPSAQYTLYTDLAKGLHQADVVISLRVQRERLQAGEFADLDNFAANYGLTMDNIQLAKADAILMHPGPINRGVELCSELADSHQSVILEQVKNGVFLRMAVLESLSNFSM